MSVNKVILLGRLGKAPESRQLPSGGQVCNFSIATDEKWTDSSGQKQSRTEWHRICVWGKLGQICSQYLHKGSQVYVEGRIETKNQDDSQGQKRYFTQINAFKVHFCDSKQTTDNSKENQSDFQLDTGPQYTADDIPF